MRCFIMRSLNLTGAAGSELDLGRHPQEGHRLPMPLCFFACKIIRYEAYRKLRTNNYNNKNWDNSLHCNIFFRFYYIRVFF